MKKVTQGKAELDQPEDSFDDNCESWKQQRIDLVKELKAIKPLEPAACSLVQQQSVGNLAQTWEWVGQLLDDGELPPPVLDTLCAFHDELGVYISQKTIKNKRHKSLL